MPDDEIFLPNDGQQTVQDHPEDLNNDVEYGDNNKELPEQLQGKLRALLRKFMKEEMWERRWEVITGRRLRFYERGFQHITWSEKNWTFSQVTPGMTTYVGQDQVQAPNYIDDYNIFQPYLMTKMSVLTQNPPGIDFQPDDPSRSDNMEAAETAQGYLRRFYRANDQASLQLQMARLMGVSSRVVAWTRTEADAQRWGTNVDGSPKQMETTDLFGDLESKVRITATCQEECNYCVLSREINVLDAKAQNPEFRDKIQPSETGLGEESYERIARLGVLQGQKTALNIGDILQNLVTEHQAWMRPSAFQDSMCDDAFIDENDNEDNSITVRDKFNELFPDGIHMKFLGDTYVGSWNESMDDHITIGWAYEGDGMSRMPYMYPALVLQDRFNDCMNATQELYDYGWPSKWIAEDGADGDAIGDQKSEPWAIRQKKIRPGTKMQDLFYQEPYPQSPASFEEHKHNISGSLAQFILASPPAIFGGDMQDQKTAHGYAQARDQALGVIGPVWSQVKTMWSSIAYQACLAASVNPDHAEGIMVPSDDGENMQQIDPSKMQKGRFGCYPDKDSNFPESTSAKRVQLQNMLTLLGQNPEAIQSVMAIPSNWETIKDLMGVPGIDFLQSVAEEKEMREIEVLLRNNPIPPSPQELEAVNQQHAIASIVADQTGAPAPPAPDIMSMLQPSVQVDKDIDYHLYAWQYDQKWLNSNACAKEIANGNISGVQNVKLHALQHKALAGAGQAAAAPQPAQSQQPQAASPRENNPGEPLAAGATQTQLR